MNTLFLLLLALSLNFSDNGVCIDPDGAPCVASTAGGDGGPQMDHGEWYTASGDEGSGLDPHGGRVSG